MWRCHRAGALVAYAKVFSRARDPMEKNVGDHAATVRPAAYLTRERMGRLPTARTEVTRLPPAATSGRSF